MKFPHYTQLDEMDCGATCLRIISRYYGKEYSLQTLRDRCHTTREGVSMLGISDAAESIGFRCAGVRLTWKQLRNEAGLPCIVHWNQRHFIVVYRIRHVRGGYEVCVSDPARGLLEYDKRSFCASWLSGGDSQSQRFGLALLLEPSPNFYRNPDERASKVNAGFLLKYLRPYSRYIASLGLAMLTACIIGLLLPFITQSVVDVGINTGSLSYVVILLVAQLVLVLSQMFNNLIKSWLMLHVTTRVSISLVSDFLCKLMRLPIAFFDSRMPGDIMQRIDDNNRIQSFLTGSLLSIIMAVTSFVIYGIVMARYNLLILAIFLVGSVLYVLWIASFLKYRKKLDYMRFQGAADNQSNIVQLINGIQDIKLHNCEKQKRWEWEHIQARLFKISIKDLSLEQVQDIGGTFIDQTKNVVISFLAAAAVIHGDMTLGMMMAMQYIIGQLNAPLSQFIRFIQATQDASISLERMNEINVIRDEESGEDHKITEIPENADIELRNVTFQYDGPRSEKALDGVSLVIPANRVTAIVGASGSGKSTMLKMILGFYAPSEGEVTLGGLPLSDYSCRAWRRACSVVMQEGFIFSDSIARNVALTGEDIDREQLDRAFETANIDEWLEDLPLKANTRIGIDGHGISTGQKQRILIARSIYKDSKYLFMDEATNSLDANNERSIMDKLDRIFTGKTVVIIAHRLSTVANADNIVVLDHGRIAEQGTHSMLIARKGFYYNLIRNQLELGN